MSVFGLVFVLCCVFWPFVGVGVLFFFDSKTARDMVMTVPELIRALLGLPYNPAPDKGHRRWHDMAWGTLLIVSGLTLAAILLANS